MANAKRVWLFEEANATMRDELGGKGVSLAEMNNSDSRLKILWMKK